MIDFYQIGLLLGVLLVSVTLHEMMHAYMALRLGDDLAHSHGRITFNPLNHIDPILSIAMPAVFLLMGAAPIFAAKPVPINTSRISGGDNGLAIVGVAGPLTNLAIAFLAGFVLKFVGLSGVLLDITELFVLVNVGLFVFNMLPIPPLDGSRLLYAFAPESVQRVMQQIESFGIFFIIFLLVFLGPFLQPILRTGNEFILNLVL